MRGATIAQGGSFADCIFQSTRPMRGATLVHTSLVLLHRFQSTRPMRGATFKALDLSNYSFISIHAPHAGRDQTFPRALTSMS